jgi:hypothetical protein
MSPEPPQALQRRVPGAPHRGTELAKTTAKKRHEVEPRSKEGSAMGFLMEVDVDEFLELMECETEARLRVAEIMERRRRAKASGELTRSDDKSSH